MSYILKNPKNLSIAALAAKLGRTRGSVQFKLGTLRKDPVMTEVPLNGKLNEGLDLSAIKISTGIPQLVRGNPDRMAAVNKIVKLFPTLMNNETVDCPVRGKKEGDAIRTTVARYLKDKFIVRGTSITDGNKNVTMIRLWKGRTH